MAGGDITTEIQHGINFAANLLPVICMLLSAVPLLFYNINEKKMQEIRNKLSEK